MFNKFLWTVVAIMLSTSFLNAQSDSCPSVPSGLIHVSDLEWGTVNETVRVQIGSNTQSEYLQNTLSWDVSNGTLTNESNEKTVEALSLIDKLDLGDRFFGEHDTTQLSLSPFPQSDFAIYVSDTPNTVYSIDTQTFEQAAIGQITDNPSNLDVLWYAKDKAVLVVEPIYGSGYWIYDVCVDGSCFIDLNQLLGYIPERPALNSTFEQVAIYDAVTSQISVFDLEANQIIQEYEVNHQLIQQIAPVWSVGSQFIYYWAFDEQQTNYLVYQLDTMIGNTEPVVEVDSVMGDLIHDWLIMPDKHILIWVDEEVHIQCY